MLRHRPPLKEAIERLQANKMGIEAVQDFVEEKDLLPHLLSTFVSFVPKGSRSPVFTQATVDVELSVKSGSAIVQRDVHIIELSDGLHQKVVVSNPL